MHFFKFVTSKYSSSIILYSFSSTLYLKMYLRHLPPSYDSSNLHILLGSIFFDCVHFIFIFVNQCKQFSTLVAGFLLVSTTCDCCCVLTLSLSLLSVCVVRWSSLPLWSRLSLLLSGASMEFSEVMLRSVTSSVALFSPQICLSWKWMRFHLSPPKMRRSTSGSLSQSSTRTGRNQPLSFILHDSVWNNLD